MTKVGSSSNGSALILFLPSKVFSKVLGVFMSLHVHIFDQDIGGS